MGHWMEDEGPMGPVPWVPGPWYGLFIWRCCGRIIPWCQQADIVAVTQKATRDIGSTQAYSAHVTDAEASLLTCIARIVCGAVLPNIQFAADAHYHHLLDDIIVGGKMEYTNGAISVPKGPGLGVEIDRDRLAKYAELYRELGSYPYDRDPKRPGWFSVWPESRWATPGE